jgi:hypothetical protein
MQKTIERALTEDGTADRRLFFECYAFLEAQEFAKRNADPRRIEDGPDQLPDEAPQTKFKCGK